MSLRESEVRGGNESRIPLRREVLAPEPVEGKGTERESNHVSDE